jgi:hypothetical protein
MADPVLAPTAPTQTDQSVTMDPTLPEDVTVDEIAFDNSMAPVLGSVSAEDGWDDSGPPVFGSADSEDEWDENDYSHEDLMRPPMRRVPGKLICLTVNVFVRLT